MKKITSTLLALVLITTGCTVLKNGDASQRIADTAAYRVTYESLLEHPNWRLKFEQAQRDLKALESQPTIDVLAVVEILQRMPTGALQSRGARISYDAVTLVIALAGDPALKPQAADEVRKAVVGIESGMARALKDLPPIVPIGILGYPNWKSPLQWTSNNPSNSELTTNPTAEFITTTQEEMTATQ